MVEVFFPAGREFFATVAKATKAWSLQITIESPDEAVRRANGKFAVSNEAVERTLAAALAEGCEKIDLFFMVGLSGQTPAKALATVDYCRQLVERFGRDRRLGFRAYEHPEALGYRRRLHTLAEHRAALLGPTWRDMLSYETDWMSRDDIVATTYAVGRGLNDLKLEAGLIDTRTHATVAGHLATAERVLAEVEAMSTWTEPERRRRLLALKGELATANTANLVGEDELKWKIRTGIRVSLALVWRVTVALAHEVRNAVARPRGRYDMAVAHPTQSAGSAAPSQQAQDFLDGSSDDMQFFGSVGTFAPSDRGDRRMCWR